MKRKIWFGRMLSCVLALGLLLSFVGFSSVETDAATKYKINVQNAVATVNGQTVTEAAAGDAVTLTAIVPAGSVFTAWDVESTKTIHIENPEYSWQEPYDRPLWYLDEAVSSCDAIFSSPVTFTMPESDITGSADVATLTMEMDFICTPVVGKDVENFDETEEINKYGFCSGVGFTWLVSSDGVNYESVYDADELSKYYTSWDQVPHVQFEEGKYYKLESNGIFDGGWYLDDNCVFKIDGVVCTEEEYSQMVNKVANEPQTYGPLVAKTYKINVKNGTATVNGKVATEAKEGDAVTIKANSVSGKAFNGWTTSASLANKSTETTMFTMPAADVTVEATYKTVSGSSSEQNKDTSTTESESVSDSDVIDATDSEIVSGMTDAGVTDTGTNNSDSMNTNVTENESDVVTDSSSAKTESDPVSSSGQDNSDSDSGKDGSDSGLSLLPEEKDGLSSGATVAIVAGSAGGVAVVAFVFRKNILALLRAIFRG